MTIRGIRLWWLALAVGGGSLGCQTIGAATGAVKDTTAGVKDVQGTAKDATGTAGDVGKSAGALKKGDKKGDKGGDKGAAAGDKDEDGTRLGAVPSKANVPLDDEVSKEKKDAADWRKIELLGRRGYATFQVNWEDPATELKLDIYNDEGVNIASSPKRSGQQTGTRVMAEIPTPGYYFIKVSLLSGPGTVYTFKCKWSGPSGSAGVASANGEAGGAGAGGDAGDGGAASGGAPAGGGAAQATVASGGQVPNPAGPAAGGAVAGGAPAGGAPTAGVPAAGTPTAGAPAAGAPAGGVPVAPTAPGGNAAIGAPLPAATDPNHPRAKVLSSYRDEDGTLILYIDRGSASNVRAGQKGQVLQGPEGDIALAGGEFRIIRVVDATKSIARISHGIANLGAKNNRCIIHLVPWP